MIKKSLAALNGDEDDDNKSTLIFCYVHTNRNKKDFFKQNQVLNFAKSTKYKYRHLEKQGKLFSMRAEVEQKKMSFNKCSLQYTVTASSSYLAALLLVKYFETEIINLILPFLLIETKRFNFIYP